MKLQFLDAHVSPTHLLINSLLLCVKRISFVLSRLIIKRMLNAKHGLNNGLNKKRSLDFFSKITIQSQKNPRTSITPNHTVWRGNDHGYRKLLSAIH